MSYFCFSFCFCLFVLLFFMTTNFDTKSTQTDGSTTYDNRTLKTPYLFAGMTLAHALGWQKQTGTFGTESSQQHLRKFTHVVFEIPRPPLQSTRCCGLTDEQRPTQYLSAKSMSSMAISPWKPAPLTPSKIIWKSILLVIVTSVFFQTLPWNRRVFLTLAHQKLYMITRTLRGQLALFSR